MSFEKVIVTKLFGHDREVITLSVDADGLSMLHVSSKGDYYGKIDFSMDLEDAVEFANAILSQVQFISEGEK